MATSAQAGTWGFGLQAGKEQLAPAFYRHRALAVDQAILDETREGQPEVGGLAVPTFPYKPGPVIGGGAALQPRLEDTVGWLLKAALGRNTDYAQGGGVYDHKFVIDPNDSTFAPYLSIRKHIPRKDGGAATDLGETYTDCKVTGLTLQMANDMPLVTRFDFLGRKFELDYDPYSWTWANTFESWESVPVMCQTGGYIKVAGVELPVVSANVSFQNVPLDIRQEKIIGDPFLEDITIIQRRLAYQIVVKWNNPDLYSEVLAGGVGATEWSGKPFTASFEVKTVSSVDMPSTSEPYSLIVHADEVMMSQQGGIQLAGNQAVMLSFAGVALEQTEYCHFTLRNKEASYIGPAGS